MYSRGVTAFLFLTHFFAKQCDGLVDSYGPSGFRITFSEKGNLRRGCLARVLRGILIGRRQWSISIERGCCAIISAVTGEFRLGGGVVYALLHEALWLNCV
jgi:hypothetical protein